MHSYVFPLFKLHFTYQKGLISDITQVVSIGAFSIIDINARRGPIGTSIAYAD